MRTQIDSRWKSSLQQHVPVLDGLLGSEHACGFSAPCAWLGQSDPAGWEELSEPQMPFDVAPHDFYADSAGLYAC